MSSVADSVVALRARQALGTLVIDSNGNPVGHIEDLVLDRRSNSILFAVIHCGGFPRRGEKSYPIPWESLDYDMAADAYVVSAL